jgi:hypothetical protein
MAETAYKPIIEALQEILYLSEQLSRLANTYISQTNGIYPDENSSWDKMQQDADLYIKRIIDNLERVPIY